MNNQPCPYGACPGFPQWQKKADTARGALLSAVDSGGSPGDHFQQTVWQNFKKKFLAPDGRGVCMYCEGLYDGGFVGHAEHYRPKGKVTDRRQDVTHPGYYWLAYEWQNLLLSCSHCNTMHPSGPGTTHPGKLNDFPVRGSRVHKPHTDYAEWWVELALEEPLLLNPRVDRACDHYDAGLYGVLGAKTERGKVTIEICDLNRQTLVDDRRGHLDNLQGRYSKFLSSLTSFPDSKFQWYEPHERYSTYLNLWLHKHLEKSLANCPIP